MASPAKPIVSGLRLKSIDGTSFWIGADSFSEYFLHPVFLRFFFSGLAIYMLVDDGLNARAASLWQIAGLWLGVVSIILGWLWLCFEMMRLWHRRGAAPTLFTPLALVPMALLIEGAARGADHLILGNPWQGAAASAEGVVLNIVVILLFDSLHAHFVVAQHPHGSLTPPQSAEAEPAAQTHTVQVPRREAEPETAAPAPAPAAAPAPSDIPKIGPVTSVLRVGNTQIDIEQILMVRTEDHYLGIVTRSGKTLQRAKLSDLPELHASRLGMQINRSVWVAFAAITAVEENDRGQITLRLVTGDEEVVAKPRVFAFRQFYKPAAA